MTTAENHHPKPGALSADDVANLKEGDLLKRRYDDRLFRFKAEGGQCHAPERFWIITPDGQTDQCAAADMTFLGRPDADGWIAHTGGENPLPGGRVETKFWDGTWSRREYPSEDIVWTHDARVSAEHWVVGWRPHLSEAAPEVRGEMIRDINVALGNCAPSPASNVAEGEKSGHASVVNLSSRGVESSASGVRVDKDPQTLEEIGARLAASCHPADMLQVSGWEAHLLLSALAAPSNPETRPEQGEVAAAVGRLSADVALETGYTMLPRQREDLRTILAALDRTAATGDVPFAWAWRKVGDPKWEFDGNREWPPISPPKGYEQVALYAHPSPSPTGRGDRLQVAMQTAIDAIMHQHPTKARIALEKALSDQGAAS